MSIRRKIIDVIFIVISALFLILLIEFDLIERYIGYSLLPIVAAYFLGKYAERKFKD